MIFQALKWTALTSGAILGAHAAWLGRSPAQERADSIRLMIEDYTRDSEGPASHSFFPPRGDHGFWMREPSDA